MLDKKFNKKLTKKFSEKCTQKNKKSKTKKLRPAKKNRKNFWPPEKVRTCLTLKTHRKTFFGCFFRASLRKVA